MALLDTIPGVARRSAQLLLAEVGVDMRRFPSAAHGALSIEKGLRCLVSCGMDSSLTFVMLRV